MNTSAITFKSIGINKIVFGSKLTLTDHFSSVSLGGSVRLCARHQAYVTDIVIKPAVFWRLDILLSCNTIGLHYNSSLQ